MKCKMQNAKLKAPDFTFCILHFAFCIPLPETSKFVLLPHYKPSYRCFIY